MRLGSFVGAVLSTFVSLASARAEDGPGFESVPIQAPGALAEAPTEPTANEPEATVENPSHSSGPTDGAIDGSTSAPNEAVTSPEPPPSAPTTASASSPSPSAPISAAEPPRAKTPAERQAERQAARAKRPRDPKIVVAGGPLVGPHAIGNEECRTDSAQCETTGGFIGLGGQLEVRGRIYWPLYAHARVLAVGNGSARDGVHAGLWGLGAGLGVYGRYAFFRAEYAFLDTFGSDRFSAPFTDSASASDSWGHHAGVFSAGFRVLFKERWGAELWGGPMVGPRSTRRIPDQETERRTLVTFLLGVNISFDAWQ